MEYPRKCPWDLICFAQNVFFFFAYSHTMYYIPIIDLALRRQKNIQPNNQMVWAKQK